MTAPFYRSAEWRAFRARILRHRQGVCAVPGCPRRATHVDHLDPVRTAPSRALDPLNVQALCHAHHSAKTAGADGGFGNPRGGGAPLRVKGCDADGVPLDPRHPWRRG